jgi:hypothetical protein
MTTNFYVAYDLDRTHIEQIDDIGFTTLCLLGCKEAPFAVTNGPKITISYPMGLFAWVSSFSPLPEVFENTIVNVVKGFLRTRVAVVVGPSPHHRVEHS